MNEIASMTLQHLLLSLQGVVWAVLAGIPLGWAAHRRQGFRSLIFTISEWLQIFPTLALLALLLFVWGLSDTTLIAALFLYSLLPIVLATHAGLAGINPSVREAAVGMGMNRRQYFWRIQLPLALPHLLNGIRIALVTAVGITTVGVLVGAGGLGKPIWRGIQTQNTPMILSGAIPTAVLAIGIDLARQWLEKRITPWKSAPDSWER